ncbi:hypothetical protein BDW02DRAFT_241315 [Decorospora gaudefroyi]|uniref:Uncharacterized protein n=1 Tax=Decorospora gaudefroyi TaxID=184978 RepID=A0A6A5KPR2_9PLEO|nr:hypothetical protein BDW02DRAFT_241315 [Decorospora gaudefroyi]
MATTSNTSPTTAPSNPSPTTEMPRDTDPALPGIKRGIAIGVASSLCLIFIALLAFFAIRRRKRMSSRNKIPKTSVDDVEAEAWSQEKAWWTATPPSAPPVEADTRTIYELDATQIPEMPSCTDAQAKERFVDEEALSKDEFDLYAQKSNQWQAWSIAIEPNSTNHTFQYSPSRLPLLTISPPGAAPGEISPLLHSPWHGSSRSTSPVHVVSPLPSAHVPSGRHGFFKT